MANCIISGNEAINGLNGGSGSGIAISSNVGTGSIKNSIISGNRGGSGGGIYLHSTNMILTNNTFTGNFSRSNGGAIWYFGSNLQMANNIVALNAAAVAGPDIWKQSTQAVISDQGYNLIGNTSSSGSNWNGTGNIIGLNPNFIENAGPAPSASGNFSLSPSSPAFNAGNPDTTNLNLGDIDVFGNKRLAGRIDMGAVEVNPAEGLHFDGIDDYVLIDLAPNFFFESDYTIETWVKFDGDPKNQNIFVLSDQKGPEDFYTHQIRVNKDGYFEHATFEQDYLKFRTHPVKPEADTWYHIAISASSQSTIMNMTVNGIPLQFEPLFTFGNTSGGNLFYIGHPACGHESFKGTMDELRIWNYITDTGNVQNLDSNEPGLLYHYRFNQGERRRK